jgi:hypothetical protein
MKRWRTVGALFVVALAPCSVFGGESYARAGDPSPRTVVLLRLTTSDAVTTEATARVNGELKAAGFDVAIVLLSSDDAKRQLESAGRELNALAAFAIFATPSDGGTSAAEIWVSDRIRQKIVIQRALLREADRNRESEILAVRAVELLKANLTDFWVPTSTPSEAEPPAPAPVHALPGAEPKARTPFAKGFGAGLGAEVTETFGAVGARWSPDAVVSYGWPGGFSVRASLIGLGPSVTLAATNGSANVQEQVAILEGVKAWWPRAALVPFVLAGAGAQHFHVAGVANPPYQGHTSDRWSLLTTVGVGLAMPVVSTVSIVLQARGIAAWSSAVVQIASAEAGRVGGPSLVADGGLFGVLP